MGGDGVKERVSGLLLFGLGRTLTCWFDLDLVSRNYDEAIRVMHRATALPKNVKISYHDQVRCHTHPRAFRPLTHPQLFTDTPCSSSSVQISQIMVFLRRS